MKNAGLVQRSLEWMWAQGIRDIVICPGGRNSPYVVALQKSSEFQVHSAFDERAASFFALGLAQTHDRPAAIITTSGTAVAEVLPAVMEAEATATPLLVVSADRPRALRGTGAPQTVDQIFIFGRYVENCVDIEDEFPPLRWTQTKPLHLNVCFDEPLIDGEVSWTEPTPELPPSLPIREWRQGQLVLSNTALLQSAWQEFMASTKSPLLIVSGLKDSEREWVLQWLPQWQGLIYCEGTSGLREAQVDRQVLGGESSLQQLFRTKKFDAVVRLGGVPTTRLWRDIEISKTPVFSYSSLAYPGLSESRFFSGSLRHLDLLTPPPREPVEAPEDRAVSGPLAELLLEYPNSEPGLVAALSRSLPWNATLYVGNSLPIRYWDAFADRARSFPVYANRGVNGIDGQLSSALARLAPQKELWVFLGDLTALYDSTALWFWRANPHPLKVVIMNNRGGRIFERLFNNEAFYNSHDLQFKSWAEQWGLPHYEWNPHEAPPSGSAVLELRPQAEQTEQFWQAHRKLWTPR